MTDGIISPLASFTKDPSVNYPLARGYLELPREFSFRRKKMGDRRDSNPQQPEPQSGALPLSYGHH